jgi:hypothetical protein
VRPFEKDQPLRLLSLGVAVALFLVVRGERESSRTFNIPLQARAPAGLAPTTALPTHLTVSVIGPWSMLRSLSDNRLGPVTLDLNASGPGVAAWFVRPQSIHLPAGVRITSLFPAQGTVELAKGDPVP